MLFVKAYVLGKVHLQRLSVKGPSPCRKAVFGLNLGHAVETWLVGTIHERQSDQEDKRNHGKANRYDLIPRHFRDRNNQ